MNKAILILYTYLRTQLLTIVLNQKLTKKPTQKTLSAGHLHEGKLPKEGGGGFAQKEHVLT